MWPSEVVVGSRIVFQFIVRAASAMVSPARAVSTCARATALAAATLSPTIGRPASSRTPGRSASPRASSAESPAARKAAVATSGSPVTTELPPSIRWRRAEEMAPSILCADTAASIASIRHAVMTPATIPRAIARRRARGLGRARAFGSRAGPLAENSIPLTRRTLPGVACRVRGGV